MARDPLSLFTDALTQGLGAGRARGNDDLAMLQAQQQQQQWNEGRASRDAALRGQQLQNEASQFELENARRANSKRLAGEALLRMQSDPEWIHTPEGQRAISSAVNESPEYDDEGIEGFKTLGRDEARLMGMDDGVYSRIVASNHPDGVDDPNDRLVVPLKRGESGDLVPFDMDDQGNVTTYSMSRLNSVLQTLAGNPDAVGEAMGSLYTGQPGASVQAYGAPGGGGGGAPASGGTSVGTSALAAPAASQTPQNGSSAPQYRTEDLAMTPPQSTSGGRSTVAAQTAEPPADESPLQQGVNIYKGVVDTGKAVAADVTDSIKSTYNRFFGKDGAEVASRLPAVEGESQESATGRPASALSKDALRASRRVFEGKGVSAAQAKQLADDPEQAAHIRNTDPTPRAIAGATANVMSGMQQRSGRGGAPEFTVGAGKKPSTKQLSSAALLMSAGVIKPEDLKRYADLGVISEDGVSTMQQGMVSATSRANNYDSNATSVRNTDASNAAAMARTQVSENAQNARFKYGQDRQDQRLAMKAGIDQQAALSKEQRAQTDPVKQNETLSGTIKNLLNNKEYREGPSFIEGAMQAVGFGAPGLNASDMSEEEIEAFSREAGNRIAPALNALPASSRTPDDQRKYSEAYLRLQNMAAAEDGPLNRWGRSLQGKPNSFREDSWASKDLTSDPLALSFVANNSSILNEQTGSLDRYNETVAQPMASALKEAGRANLIKDPNVRRGITQYVTSRLARDAAKGEENVWNDDERIKRYIRAGAGATAGTQ